MGGAGVDPDRGSRPRRRTEAERRADRAAVDDPDRVFTAGLRYLEARSRSVDETRRRLRDAGYRPELIETALDRLISLGLLDDAAFATAWVESRDRAHPRGERALRQELRRRGLADSVIDEALAGRSAGPSAAFSGPTEGHTADPDEQAARRLIGRRSAALGRVADPRARRQRAYALLARHGFPPELAARVATEATADREVDEVDVGETAGDEGTGGREG